uniref:Gustatory receptor 29 n=1 Tax=Bombyx mori TaxID=7091 RepID=A0A1L7NV11_BOMMO|nr:gustatory receptor 29 [Bombyx mori]
MYLRSKKSRFKLFSFERMIKILLMICGHYVQTDSSNVVSSIHRLFSIAITICLCPNFEFNPFYFHVIESVLYSILSQFTQYGFFFRFCSTIKTFDLLSGFKQIPLYTKRVCFFLLITLFMRLFTVLIHFLAYQSKFVTFCAFIIMLSANTGHILMTIMFSTLHTRMKSIQKLFANNPIPVNIVGKNENASHIKRVRKGLICYNNLLDTLKDAEKEIQFTLTVTCLCHVPKIICYVYFVITVIYKSKFSGYNLVPLFDMILACMAVTAPAVFAELTKNTVDKIKKILGSQLLRCSDESLRYELEITLEYVIQRPFSFSIWRAVSLDASLPVAMTSLCITYVIVILQLTQLRP